MPGRYAAIDIGTVTCRLMVADVAPGPTVLPEVNVVARDMAVVNLGEGVDHAKRIGDAAISRAANAIDAFCATIRSLDAPENPILATSVVATSAARDASNSSEFMEMLAERGLDASIISGSEEAALSFFGASASRAGDPVMVVDSGGGSTEIAIGIGASQPCASHSFDVGCRRITERFIHAYPPSPADVDRARCEVSSQLLAWEGRHALPLDAQMIAVAGTATSTVTIRDGIAVYDPDLVDGRIVTAQELDEVLGSLIEKSLPELEQVVGLEVRRAPVICAGMLILSEVMRVFGMERFTVSESDILDGMIMYNSMHLST